MPAWITSELRDEVSLPMMRDNPSAYMQFSDQRVYMSIALALMAVCMVISLHVERSRFGRSLLSGPRRQVRPATGVRGGRCTGRHSGSGRPIGWPNWFRCGLVIERSSLGGMRAHHG